MANCLIGLGSNQGERRQTLREAINRIAQLPNTRVVATSRPLETNAVGGPADQPPFLNSAIVIDTALGPQELLASLLTIEAELGRRRDVYWGPRTVDLDLLLYDDLVLNEPGLTLPHPRMTFRRFVLAVAAQVAPERIHPTTGLSLQELLLRLDTSPQYIALAGPEATANRALATAVAAAADVRLIQGQDAPAGGGRDESAAIKWLERQAELLSPVRGEPERATISDFWFPGLRHALATEPHRPLAAAVERRWSQLCAATPPAKLVVWVAAAAPARESLEPSCRSACLTLPAPGDREWLASSTAELVAALTAMR
jgi:2-amino-4-hydroxy-6-hydroxymethyldihydropteridine diphosphokinase